VTQRLPSKSKITLNRGDKVKIFMGGGGGYGDPRERHLSLKKADIRNGLVVQL
jgi:N-methylhydantoinase B